MAACPVREGVTIQGMRSAVCAGQGTHSMMDSDLAMRTAAHLRAAAANAAKPSVVVGLDGFVDEIIRVVNKRFSATECTMVERISDLAARISGAAGQSTNMELLVNQVKIGGNGPIMANALDCLGGDVTCVGPMGDGSVHFAFAE